MKEFNLSEKELTPHEFYEHQGGFTKEDVKEFIKKLKEKISKNVCAWDYIIDKLAGEKLK